MTTQTSQPIERESVTVTFTFDEFQTLLNLTHGQSRQLHNKLQFLNPNSGDACRHLAQSPDVVGQGGTLKTCRHRLNSPEPFAPCRYCYSAETLGQGGNQ